jgi:hypothetical protein
VTRVVASHAVRAEITENSARPEAFLLQLRLSGFVRDNTSTSSSIAFPMAEIPDSGQVRSNSSAGHLAVHIEGAHPVDVPFLFEEQQKRIGPAFVASLGYHIVMIAALIFAIKYGTHAAGAVFLPEQPNNQIIWLSEPGPGGGGGGGGNRMKEPPRQAEAPGKDKITVPV